MLRAGQRLGGMPGTRRDDGSDPDGGHDVQVDRLLLGQQDVHCRRDAELFPVSFVGCPRLACCQVGGSSPDRPTLDQRLDSRSALTAAT